MRANQKKLLRTLVTAILAVGFVLLVIALSHTERTPIVSTEGQSFEKAVVTQMIHDNVQEDGSRTGEQKLRVRMLTGLRTGQTVDTTSSAGYLFGAPCKVGMHVIVMQSVSGKSTITSVYSQDRAWVLYLFAALYLAVLLLVGGRQGLKAAGGLAFTFVSVLGVYLPLVYRGFSPLLAAVLVCAGVSTVTLLLIGGFSRKTAAAIGGTISGVAVAAVAAMFFSAASGITGYNVANIESLLSVQEVTNTQVGGLLFSGLLISSLGAIMDVAMSISSAMSEVWIQSSNMSRRALWKSGMRIGRDMMATDSSTLILAFAGGSISMLVLNYAYNLPYLQVINSNNIGIAVLQGLSGSFGIVLCVPLTVALATWLLVRRSTSAAVTPAAESTSDAANRIL